MNSPVLENLPPLWEPLRPGDVPHPVLVAAGVSKVYGKGDGAVYALRDVSLEIGRAHLTAIMGPSGSGKTTLLHCLAGLDSVTSGSIALEGAEITSMKERQLTKLRRDKIGFVFQAFNLIPTLTAKENITLPASIAKRKIDPERLRSVIQAVGLADRLKHRPSELSGGQQQRVACARALVTAPAVVFADEPTGNLDSRASAQVLRFLRQAVDDFQQTVVMVTHEPEAAAWADRVIFLADGQIAAELFDPTRESILEALRILGGEAEADIAEPTQEATPPSIPQAPDRTATLDLGAPQAELEDELSPVRLEEALERIAPAPSLPAETARVLDRAQQILGDLPGPLMNSDGPPPAPPEPESGNS